MTSTQDDILATKIIDAMKEVDAADATRKEKIIIAGKLLAEAHKLHPTEEAFKKFLARAGGIQIRRAQELIAIALGRKGFEQHQAENAAKQQRHRDKLKAERDKAKAALPKPKRDAGAALRNASAADLRQFELACNYYLPRLSVSDLQKAEELFRRIFRDLAQQKAA